MYTKINVIKLYRFVFEKLFIGKSWRYKDGKQGGSWPSNVYLNFIHYFNKKNVPVNYSTFLMKHSVFIKGCRPI